MKLTKYEHACLVIEQGGQRLVIDPGVFSTSFTDFSNVTAVVVTHVHPDHLDADKLNTIKVQNPKVQIYTVQAVADKLKDSVPLNVVTGGHKAEAGPFKLDFFGGQHALIHASIPVTDNVGVMVNATLYYPGDSFSLPHQPIDTLAVPATGPWMKVAEAMDFITAAKPKQVFPTPNAILSEIGANIHGALLEMACKSIGTKYLALKPNDVVDIGRL